jgi:hypothetical protein
MNHLSKRFIHYAIGFGGNILGGDIDCEDVPATVASTLKYGEPAHIRGRICDHFWGGIRLENCQITRDSDAPMHHCPMAVFGMTVAAGASDAALTISACALRCGERSRRWLLGVENMKFIVYAALAIALSVSAANAKCDTAGLVLDGFFSHGAIECNPDWLDRRASYFAVEWARTCGNLKDSKKYILAGMMDFEKRTNLVGKTNACRELDAEMKALEKKLNDPFAP